MEEFFKFIEANTGIIINWTTLAALASAAMLYVVKKLVPLGISSLQTMVIKVVANLFGESFGKENDVVTALPFIKSFDTFGKDMEINMELRLLDFKRQLASPLYTDAQKAAIKVMYDKLYAQIGARLSPEAAAALKAYEV